MPSQGGQDPRIPAVSVLANHVHLSHLRTKRELRRAQRGLQEPAAAAHQHGGGAVSGFYFLASMLPFASQVASRELTQARCAFRRPSEATGSKSHRVQVDQALIAQAA